MVALVPLMSGGTGTPDDGGAGTPDDGGAGTSDEWWYWYPW